MYKYLHVHVSEANLPCTLLQSFSNCTQCKLYITLNYRYVIWQIVRPEHRYLQCTCTCSFGTFY